MMQKKQTQPEYTRWLTTATLILATGMFLVLLRYLATHYYIKAYSDPGSWLRSGYVFIENFGNLHLPLGYPAYLWIMLHVLDPVQIFLANIPLLIFLGMEISLLAYIAGRKHSPPLIARLTALLAISFYFLYDPAVLAKLTNLYRDPLAHGLLLLSILLFILYLQKNARPTILLIASGLLLGFAYCTREPSIMVVAPMGLTGLVFVRKDKIPFWKNVILFSISLLAGCLPVLLQTVFTQDQLSISPYASYHGRMLPGLHVIALPRTFPSAWHYFTTGFKGFLTLAGITGFIFSLIHKDRFISCLIAPCALMYFAFYCFYWNFFERYFFTAGLFLIPLAAYGALQLVAWVLSFKPIRSIQVPAISILVLITMIVSGGHLLRIPKPADLFQIPQARKLEHDINQAIPTNGLILCSHQNLGNTIYAITHHASANMERMLYKQEWTDQTVREKLSILTADDTPLFLLAEDKPVKTEIYQRHMNVRPVATLRGSDYHLASYFGTDKLILYKLTPWNKSRTEVQIAPPQDKDIILQIDPLTSVGTSTIHVTINDQTLPDLYTTGSHYYYHSFTSLPESIHVALQSEVPLPDTFPVRIHPLDRPLNINVGFFSYPSHQGVFADYPATNLSTHPLFMRITDQGRIHLPTPWTNTTYKTTWMLRNPGTNQHPVTIQIDDTTLFIPPGRKPKPFDVILTCDSNQPEIELTIQIQNNPKEQPAYIEVDRIFVLPDIPR